MIVDSNYYRKYFPMVEDIRDYAPKREYLDNAVMDSVIRYKTAMEAEFSMLKVNVFFDVNDEKGCLNGFSIELVFKGLKSITIEFTNFENSAIYNLYLSGAMDLSGDKYKYLGSSVWAVLFNKCANQLKLDGKYYVGFGVYSGVSLCRELGFDGLRYMNTGR